MGIVGTRQITDILLRAKILQPIPLHVIQHPDLVVRIIDVLGSDNRLFEDVERLVVSRDEDIDRRESR